MAIILRARLPRLPRLLFPGHTEDFSPQKLHNMEIEDPQFGPEALKDPLWPVGGTSIPLRLPLAPLSHLGATLNSCRAYRDFTTMTPSSLFRSAGFNAINKSLPKIEMRFQMTF